jgi:hypothetical protein
MKFKKPKKFKEIIIGLFVLLIIVGIGAFFVKKNRDEKIIEFQNKQSIAYNNISEAARQLKNHSEKITTENFNDSNQNQQLVNQMNDANKKIAEESSDMIDIITNMERRSQKVDDIAIAALSLNISTKLNQDYYDKYKTSENIEVSKTNYKIETIRALNNNNTIINNFNSLKAEYDKATN